MAKLPYFHIVLRSVGDRWGLYNFSDFFFQVTDVSLSNCLKKTKNPNNQKQKKKRKKRVDFNTGSKKIKIPHRLGP